MTAADEVNRIKNIPFTDEEHLLLRVNPKKFTGNQYMPVLVEALKPYDHSFVREQLAGSIRDVFISKNKDYSSWAICSVQYMVMPKPRPSLANQNDTISFDVHRDPVLPKVPGHVELKVLKNNQIITDVTRKELKVEDANAYRKEIIKNMKVRKQPDN